MNLLNRLLKMNRAIHVVILILFAGVWVNSEWNFYKVHGRATRSDETAPLFVDESAKNEFQSSSLTETPEGQMYFWMLIGGVLIGAVIWKCDFESDSSGD